MRCTLPGSQVNGVSAAPGVSGYLLDATNMSEQDRWAILNGEQLPISRAHVPVVDEGFLRGDGVFEVLRLYQGGPFKAREHLARLARSAEIMRLPYDERALEAEVERLAQLASGGDYGMRIVLTRGGVRLLLLEALPQLDFSARLVPIVDQPPSGAARGEDPLVRGQHARRRHCP